MNQQSVADLHDLILDRLNVDRPAWRRALELDSAICRVFFSESNSGRPVYLDVDSERLEACGELLNMSGSEFLDQLVQSVRALLVIDDPGTPIFRRYEAANLAWFRKLIAARSQAGVRLPPPPTIGLLAVLVVPAEQMGLGGVRGGGHQRYYPPLLELLQIPAEAENRFRTHFAKVSESFWRGLNAWLESEDGRFGLPTAYALSHRYVGLPVSQALIRETERRQLKRVFVQYRLTPTDVLSEDEMWNLLNQWITQIGSPASKQLKRLWQAAENQEQLSSIALTELRNWDGLVENGPELRNTGGIIVNKARVYLVERQKNLFMSAASLGLTVRLPAESDLRGFSLQTNASPLFPEMRVLRDGLVGFEAQAEALDPSSLLEGKVVLSTEDGLERTRIPRDIVPLEYDDIAGAWIEMEAVELGQQYRLVVREESWGRAEELLKRISTKNYVSREIDGIPSGWMLVDNVTITSAPLEGTFEAEDYQFSALSARPAKRAVLSGGLRLPGRIQRYSSLAIPSLTVVSDEPSAVSVLISSRDFVDDGPSEVTIGPWVPPFKIDLADYLSEDGDYEILLRQESSPIQSISLRLRSSNEPDLLGWSSFQQLAHGIPDPMWPLRAKPAIDLEEVIVEGAQASGAPIEIDETSPGELSIWSDYEQNSDGEIRHELPLVPRESCVFTGAHHMRFPSFDATSFMRGWIWGDCQHCGLRKRSPANHKLAAARGKSGEKNISPSAIRSAPASQESVPSKLAELNWDVSPASNESAVDALIYVGHGTIEDVRQVARQVNNSGIFAHFFTRAVEDMALIEVERDDFGAPVRFELAPTVLTTTSTNEILLVGPWTPTARTDLQDFVEKQGGVWNAYDSQGFILEEIKGISFEQVEAEYTGETSLLKRAGLGILERLPSLSSIGVALPRVSFVTHADTVVFSPNDAKWVRAREFSELPGAYLQPGFQSHYYYRGTDDISNRQAAISDVYTVKHLAALAWGKTLLQFDAEESELIVPLGCDLPGLFARAAVLEGGVLPEKRGKTLVYSGISDYFAELLLNKLSQ